MTNCNYFLHEKQIKQKIKMAHFKVPEMYDPVIIDGNNKFPETNVGQ